MTQEEKIAMMEKTLKTLRIPDAIKDIPPFNGNKTDLSNFIGQVDDVLTILKPAFEQQAQAKVLLRAIRNKIVGNANDVLIMYNTKVDWPSIKQNLINHFADKRDETSLIRDLHNIAQRGDTVEVFFAKILEVINALKNWVELNTLNNPEEVIKKCQWYDEMGLAAFISNLRDPLGSMVRAMRPTDLPTARLYCLKEQNITYVRNRTFGHSNPTILNTRPTLPPKPIVSYNQKLLYPRQPVQNFNPLRNQNQYFNHRPFTQNNPNLIVKQGNLPPKPLPKPEPMDTSSNMDRYKQPTYNRPQQFQQRQYNPVNQPYRFNSYGPQRVQTRELFNIATNPYQSEFDNEMNQYDQEYDQYFEENYQEIDNNHEQYQIDDVEENNPIVEIEDSDFCPATTKNSDT